MKVFKLFLILTAVVAMSYFSWSFYNGRLLHKKHEKAILVLVEHCNRIKNPGLEGFPCI